MLMFLGVVADCSLFVVCSMLVGIYRGLFVVVCSVLFVLCSL